LSTSTSAGLAYGRWEPMADAQEPLPTQRCRLHGGRFDGQLRLVATGPTLTLTVQHQVEGELWAEIYTQEHVAGADVPVAGLVRDLVFRERCPVRRAGDHARDTEG